MAAIDKGRFKGQEAVVLETDALRAVILPGWGSKLASLVYKPLGYETLWQNTSPAYSPTRYGDVFETGEFAGFDEMFPTISRCFYESFPWAGFEMPDHGEVWTLPWEYTVERDSVRLSVHGVRFPYHLEKQVSVEGARLVIRYKASNLSGAPFDFIWAAHPLFNASEGMRFIVPPGMDRIVNAVAGRSLGAYGKSYGFPVARPADGGEVRLDRMPPRNDYGYQKYWFAGKVTEGWCMLRDGHKKLTIAMAYPAEKVPYLGMWLNEGGYAGQYNIAPEPATGAMDRVDSAKMWGMGSVLAPGGASEWHLIISLAEGREATAVRPDGVLVS